MRFKATIISKNLKKVYCEYCGIYLTKSSPKGRKEHNRGRKHKINKIEYYSHFIVEYQENLYKTLSKIASGPQGQELNGSLPSASNIYNKGIQYLPTRTSLNKEIN